MVQIKRECDNCICPIVSVLTVTICPGFVENKIFKQPKACAKWKPAPDTFTSEEAVNYARFKGVRISRPTLLKLCKTEKIGRQLGGTRGKWIIFPDKLRAVLNLDHKE